MILRILEPEWTAFVENMCSRADVETAGIILAERLHGGRALFARHLIVVPDDGYQVRQDDRLRIDPITINRLVRRARDSNLSVITAHTHPGANQPWFSSADDEGDSRLIPSLFAQMQGPHGSLVIAGKSGIPTARLWTEPGIKCDASVRVVGRILHVHPARADSDNAEPWFERQSLALGHTGQAVLRDLHVGVVGLGGTGSVAFVQLAHLGVGQITVIDGDRVERSNVSRIVGATCRDADVAWKVDVAGRYAKRLGLGTCVYALRGNLGAEVSAAELEGCDVVLSCVDRHLPRALMNRLAYEKGILLIDMGSAFRVDKRARITAGAGRVVIVGPTRRCLGCWGHIDAERLRIETLPDADRADQVGEGYITGADVPQPSVIAFNTTIAGAAVVELLRLTTRFAGAGEPPMRLSFDFAAGTVRRNRLDATHACAICSPETPLS